MINSDILTCFQCGTCHASCPSGRYTSLNIRKIVRDIQKIGFLIRLSRHIRECRLIEYLPPGKQSGFGVCAILSFDSVATVPAMAVYILKDKNLSIKILKLYEKNDIKKIFIIITGLTNKKQYIKVSYA